MDKWVSILLEVEEMWEGSRERMAAAWYPMTEDYRRERDFYKARRILDLYGYDYFRKFVERCPHILDLIEQYGYSPCETGDGNCSMMCIFYKNGGCTNATKRMD